MIVSALCPCCMAADLVHVSEHGLGLFGREVVRSSLQCPECDAYVEVTWPLGLDDLGGDDTVERLIDEASKDD